MDRCQGIKRDGGRCTAPAQPGSSFCYNHDPTHAEKRKRNASRAGKSHSSREITHLKTLLSDLTDKVLEGSLETARAAVANQLINTHLRAIEIERKIKEADELEARIEALENRTNLKGARGWQRR